MLTSVIPRETAGILFFFLFPKEIIPYFKNTVQAENSQNCYNSEHTDAYCADYHPKT